MEKKSIKEIYKEKEKYIDKKVEIQGWIKTIKIFKDFSFIQITDGSTLEKIQIVLEKEQKDYEKIKKLTLSSAIKVIGILIKNKKDNEKIEIKTISLEILSLADKDYPLQKKKHSFEYLRTVAHLRPRTDTFNAIFRIRSVAAFAIHEYFQKNGYVYVTTPIITSADCEGSGEMFKLTTFDLDRDIPKKDGRTDYSKDMFGRKVYITGSGQLHGETFSQAYGKIYTFGPTLRSEDSNTKTHVNEFWMIEPEISFCDLDQLMDIEEDFLKYVVSKILERCKEEIKFCDKFIQEGLLEKLTKMLKSKFIRIDHEEAIKILKNADVKWEFEPKYGEDLAKEHEKYITKYFGIPVFIKKWPKDIKAYYMKLCEDGETVAAVDLEVPGAGELIGGSQREDDYEKLIKRMKEMKIDEKQLSWYTDLRRYGTVKHSGFGVGFERLLMYVTGMENIRDVIPFPRTPRSCEF